MKHTFTYQIPEGCDCMSVEELLLLHGYSRNLIVDLKKDPSYLTIQGVHVYITRKMKSEDVLSVCLPPEESSEQIVPTEMPLTIVYEDEHLMVIDKAADTPIHPSQGNFANTLANGVAWYFAQQGEPFVYRVINRLDRDTTGLLILAKHALSACILSDMVRNRKIHRTYLAAVSGDARNAGISGIIDAPIARVDGSTIERQVDFIRGERAITHYQVLHYQKERDASLVQLQLETGRTHQIRVHMSYLGYPLFGDFLYHPDYRYIKRQSLHSYQLSFLHPITKEPLTFTAAVPDDMKQFLNA